MSDLARQQADFQRAILSGDDSVLAEIPDSPKEKRETLFGVYRYASDERLAEAAAGALLIVAASLVPVILLSRSIVSAVTSSRRDP